MPWQAGGFPARDKHLAVSEEVAYNPITIPPHTQKQTNPKSFWTNTTVTGAPPAELENEGDLLLKQTFT